MALKEFSVAIYKILVCPAFKYINGFLNESRCWLLIPTVLIHQLSGADYLEVVSWNQQSARTRSDCFGIEENKPLLRRTLIRLSN